MGNIQERIKEIRKRLELTQQEMADLLGVGRSTVNTWENGNGAYMSKSSAILICSKLNISEHWLETGEGEMFNAPDKKDVVTEIVERVLANESPSFKQRLIVALSQLDEDDWVRLEEFATKVLGNEEEEEE